MVSTNTVAQQCMAVEGAGEITSIIGRNIGHRADEASCPSYLRCQREAVCITSTDLGSADTANIEKHYFGITARS